MIDGLGYGVGPLPTPDSDLQQRRISAPFPEIALSGGSYQALVPLDPDSPAICAYSCSGFRNRR